MTTRRVSNESIYDPKAQRIFSRQVLQAIDPHARGAVGWKEYSLYSNRLNPRGPGALPPPIPKDEFGLARALGQEVKMAEEYTGLFGFVFKSFKNALFPDRNKGKEVFYQGSRQMDSTSRRYYEKELGAVMGPSLGFDEAFGYSEPFRRFVQREGFEPQANEIPKHLVFPSCPTQNTPRTRGAALAHFSALRSILGWLLKTQGPLFRRCLVFV